MPVSPWITGGPDFPYQFSAILNGNNVEPGDNQHLIIKYKQLPEPGLYLSYKMIKSEGPGPETLEGNFKIDEIRYLFREGVDLDPLIKYTDYSISFKSDDPAIPSDELYLTHLTDEAAGTEHYYATQGSAYENMEIDSEVFDYLTNALRSHMPVSALHSPLSNNTLLISADALVKDDHYHVYTHEGGDYKHEGHGKFFGLQNNGKDARFEPFTIDNASGTVLESQVFEVANSFFYKLTNIKGGKRKSRKSRRKTRKSRNTRRRR